jgi:hypothetical protein
MVIYFGLFAIITILIFRQPAAAVGALLCTYGVEQWAQSQSPFFFTHQWLTNLMTAGVLLFALLARFLKGKPVINPVTREYWVMTALYALAIASVSWSIAPLISWEQLNNYLKYVAVFGFLMPLAVSDRDDLKVTLYTMLSLGVAVCSLLLVTADWADRKVIMRSGAAIGSIGLERGNPLAVATLGGQVAMASLLMNFKGTASFWRVFRYIVFGVGFALTVKSGSRGQTFALIIATLAFFPFSRRFKDLKGFIGFAISIIIFGALVVSIADYFIGQSANEIRVEDRWSWQAFVDAYQGGRINTSLILLSFWFEGGPLRWIVGLGSSASFDPAILGNYPHIVLAEVLGELGVIGWLILWLVPIFAYRAIRELWDYVKDDPEDRGMIATLAALFLFDVILSFKQGSLLGTSSTFGLAVILGRLRLHYANEVAVYKQLDAGGYSLTEEERALYDTDEAAELQPGVAMGR